MTEISPPNSTPQLPANFAECAPYCTPLYRFALLMTGTESTAVSVFDQTIEGATRRFGHFRSAAKARNWLFSRAIRLACNPQLISQSPDTIRSTTSPNATLGNDVSDKTIEDIFPKIFTSLPQKERAALGLFYLNLFSSAEIAHLLDFKLQELANCLHTARTKLQEHPLYKKAHDSKHFAGETISNS